MRRHPWVRGLGTGHPGASNEGPDRGSFALKGALQAVDRTPVRKNALIIAALAAIAIPATAAANNGHGQGHGQGHGPKAVSYICKGSYAGGGSVDVNHGNGHVKRAGLVDTTVQFDLSSAKLTVADTNGDGTVDANDVATGDKVLVQARLPKGDPGAQPFAAKHLVDQTNSS